MSECRTDDPFIEAEVARALEPYQALLAPEALGELRDALRDALSAHPVAIDLVGRLRPRAAVAESAEVHVDPSASAVKTTPTLRSRGGAR
jgi:hypothetical protein